MTSSPAQPSVSARRWSVVIRMIFGRSGISGLHKSQMKEIHRQPSRCAATILDDSPRCKRADQTQKILVRDLVNARRSAIRAAEVVPKVGVEPHGVPGKSSADLVPNCHFLAILPIRPAGGQAVGKPVCWRWCLCSGWFGQRPGCAPIGRQSAQCLSGKEAALDVEGGYSFLDGIPLGRYGLRLSGHPGPMLSVLGGCHSGRVESLALSPRRT